MLNSLVIGICLITCCVLGYMVFKNFKNKSKKNEEVVKETEVIKTQEEISNSESIQSIILCNLEFRLKNTNKDLEIAFESLCDKLIFVVEIVNEDKNYTENTPLINRMATNYLPKFTKTFLNVDAEKRVGAENQFKAGLESLNQTLSEVITNLENENNEEYAKQVGFIKAFFDGDYTGGDTNVK